MGSTESCSLLDQLITGLMTKYHMQKLKKKELKKKLLSTTVAGCRPCLIFVLLSFLPVSQMLIVQ